MEETELVKALKMVIETQAALIKELSSRPHATTVHHTHSYSYPQMQISQWPWNWQYQVYCGSGQGQGGTIGGTLQGQVGGGFQGGQGSAGQAGGGGGVAVSGVTQTVGYAQNQNNCANNSNLHAGMTSGIMTLVQNG